VEILNEAGKDALLHSFAKIILFEVLLIFFIAVAIQIFFYLIFFSRLADYKASRDDQENLPPVTVVICAHDEINRLKKNLPAILEQKYPQYEVIVVNDNSEDDSEMMLTRMQAKYPHLVVRDIRNSSKQMRGKKYPLTIGIRAASHEHVLLTDADCAPSSDYWIRDMAVKFDDERRIVLGYAPYRKHPGLLNKFIRYETFLTALNYFSFALAKIPYMGVGRNLAYHRQIFFDHNIYPKYPQLLSGDDDLLINAAANKRNTAIQINVSAFMFSEPKQTWDEYWHQKKRHVSTGRYYRWYHKLLLSFFSISTALFYFFLILCLLYTNFIPEALLLFAARIFIQGMVFRTTMKKLGEQDLFFLFPMMDVLFLLYYIKLLPAIIQTKGNTWK
jgi:cellulose synthase/poly-beta-1,6-N-acetylglucosamine synthase-like glycosyltransferase